jgi:hypothetical protein
MTIAKLIDLLSKFPLDTPVNASNGYGDPYPVVDITFYPNDAKFGPPRGIYIIADDVDE